MSYETITSILLGLLSAIVTIAGSVIFLQVEKLRSMREQLSERKYKAYADAVRMFYSVLKDSKLNKPTNSNERLQEMIEIKRDILMYGSDKVFKAFNKWLLSTVVPDSKIQLAAFLDFVLEMRKDLCNNKTNLTKHDILLNLTQSEEEANKLYK